MNGQFSRLTAALADRYTIERELGAGGMATVYLAEDLKHHRKVAVKVLRPELAAALGADRFLREITTTANLRHPHILPLYDSGDADGFLYYVMPFVEGESLRDRLDRDKQLSVDDALKIAREVGDALSYAHRHDVIHRDIKPENILIEEGHAVLADFGIARAVSAAGATQLTATGMSVGTPVYMSPEQAGGEAELDGRSDLYSLACVLYEMLGGQPPFTGPTVESVIHQHLAADSPPITNLRPSVPVSIAGALQRALAKNPADRFNPIAQFLEALSTHVATTAQPMADTVGTKTTTGRARRTSRARLFGVVGAVALVALVTVFLIRSGSSNAAPGIGPSVAILPFDNISPNADDAYFADGITEEITNQLSRVSDLRVVGGAAVTRALASGMSLSEIAAALNVETLLEGGVRKVGEQVRITAQLVDAQNNENLWSQDFDRDMSDVFAIQSEVARDIVIALDAQLTPAEEEILDEVPTNNTAAYNLYLRSSQLQGRLPDENGAAIELLRQAVSIDPLFAKAWALLGWRYVWKARVGDSTAIDSAFAISRHAVELDSSLAQARFALGSAFSLHGHLSESNAQFEHALALDPVYRGALRDLSAWLAYGGELSRALRIAARDLPQNPNLPNTRLHITIPLMLLGDDERTDAWLRAADAEGLDFQRLDVMRITLDILRGRRQRAIDQISAGLNTYADNYEFEGAAWATLLFLGETERAHAGLERRMRLAPNATSRVWWVTNRTLYAFALLQLGDQTQANLLFDESLSRAYAAIEGGDERVFTPMEIAAIHAVRNDTVQALQWVERSFQAGYRAHRWLELDPMFESLRGHAQFQQILARMETHVARERDRVEAEGIAFVVDSVIAAAGIPRTRPEPR